MMGDFIGRWRFQRASKTLGGIASRSARPLQIDAARRPKRSACAASLCIPVTATGGDQRLLQQKPFPRRCSPPVENAVGGS